MDFILYLRLLDVLNKWRRNLQQYFGSPNPIRNIKQVELCFFDRSKSLETVLNNFSLKTQQNGLLRKCIWDKIERPPTRFSSSLLLFSLRWALAIHHHSRLEWFDKRSSRPPIRYFVVFDFNQLVFNWTILCLRKKTA